MALGSNELYNKRSRTAFPRIEPSENGQAIVTLGAITGGATLAVVTPLARDASTGFWHVWDPANTTNERNLIKGFINPEEVDALDANEVQAAVMIRGSVHREDVVLPAGASAGQLDTALQTVHGRDIYVQGLAGAHG